MTDHASAADINWNVLRFAAYQATKRSFAPYSDIHVGAAGLLATGEIITGCNVENASYGLSFCAEVTMVGRLRMHGEDAPDTTTATDPKFVAVVATDGHGKVMAPCGRCRQILIEHCEPDAEVLLASGPIKVFDLLPGAFTSADLGPNQGIGPFIGPEPQR